MKIIDTNKLNRFWKNGVKPIKDEVAKKLSSSKVANNLLTTVSGYALDARQGKVLNDQIAAANIGGTIIAKYISQGTGLTEYTYVAQKNCELYWSFKIPAGTVSAELSVNGTQIMAMGYAWVANSSPFIIPFSCQIKKGDEIQFRNSAGTGRIELQMLVIRS